MGSQIGTIDCGYLALVQAMADKVWIDPIQGADYRAEVGSAKAVLENQRVNFAEITGAKDKQISLEWLERCDSTVDDCGDDCSVDGSDISPVCKTYELDICKHFTFKVGEKSYRTRTIEKEEAIAKNMLWAKKSLDEYIAQAIIAGLLANAGTNEWTGGQGNVVGTMTYIPAAYWDARLFGYFAQVARYNRFVSPYLIDGANLYQMVWNAMKDQPNADGKGVAAKVGSMPVYEDMVNIESGAPGDTFMLHKNAAAFVHKTYYPRGAANAISKEGGKFLLWSEESMNIPGIAYDIVYRNECEGNDFYDVFDVQLNAGFFVNPVGCTETRTGILVFECGSGT